MLLVPYQDQEARRLRVLLCDVTGQFRAQVPCDKIPAKKSAREQRDYRDVCIKVIPRK